MAAGKGHIFDKVAATGSAAGRVRVKVSFGGVRPEDIKLYAIYVDLASVEGNPSLFFNFMLALTSSDMFCF